MYFIGEDDGDWFVGEGVYKGYQNYGFLDSFSIGWANSFADAMTRLYEYVKANGEPVYYSGLEKKIICHYRL